MRELPQRKNGSWSLWQKLVYGPTFLEIVDLLDRLIEERLRQAVEAEKRLTDLEEKEEEG